MKTDIVIIRVQASGSFLYTELDDERAPTELSWPDFVRLVEDGTIPTPLVTVDVIRESR
jgi:hypothetical protein